MRVKIKRYDGKRSRYEDFSVAPKAGMTVLDALFYIQDWDDPSLSFRYSCRGAVCGSCAVLINGMPRLACRTQMSSLLSSEEEDHYEKGEKTILLEPLPHLPVIKDLVVDMEPFFAFLKRAKTALLPKEPIPEKEYMMEKEVVNALEEYTNCILCGACYGACPVNGKRAYLGPAALAKLYRFYMDPRAKEPLKYLKEADSPEGWWGCEFHLECAKVCPRGVRPNKAIGKARAELKKNTQP